MNAIKVAAVGDICPGDHYFSLGHGAGSLDHAGRQRALREIAGILSGADIAIANLEGVLSSISETTDAIESKAFRGPPEWAASLRTAGFTAINVANNHVLQHGEQALRNSVSACRNAGLDVIGLAATNGLPIPVFRAIGSIEVALIGASFVPDKRRQRQHETYASPHFDQLIEQVSTLSRSGRWVIVSLHMGTEGQYFPDRETLSAGGALAAAGARVILVHHSHVFQPVLTINGAIVATGLGNCIFDLHWHRALVTSAAVTINLSNSTRDTFEVVPFRLTRHLSIEALPRRSRDRFIGDLADRARRLLTPGDPCLDSPMWLQQRKIVHFTLNLGRGDTVAKLRFLGRKAAQFLPLLK